MGKVFSSFVKRPIRNWNVENRAQRVISQDKPQPAPRHKSTEKMIQEFTQGVGLICVQIHCMPTYGRHDMQYSRVCQRVRHIPLEITTLSPTRHITVH